MVKLTFAGTVTSLGSGKKACEDFYILPSLLCFIRPWSSFKLIHPILWFVAVFTLLTPQAFGPRIVQGFFAALCDFYLFYLAKQLFGSGVARWTVPFCLVRLILNSLGTCISSIL
jgi:hypothetical protein